MFILIAISHSYSFNWDLIHKCTEACRDMAFSDKVPYAVHEIDVYEGSTPSKVRQSFAVLDAGYQDHGKQKLQYTSCIETNGLVSTLILIPSFPIIESHDCDRGLAYMLFHDIKAYFDDFGKVSNITQEAEPGSRIYLDLKQEELRPTYIALAESLFTIHKPFLQSEDFYIENKVS